MWLLPKITCVSYMFVLALCSLSVTSVNALETFSLLPDSQQICFADQSDSSMNKTLESTLSIISEKMTVG